MTPTRDRLLASIAEMSELHPEWRLGQLISNLVFIARNPMSQAKTAEDIWDVEDDELIAVLTEHIDTRRKPLQDELLTASSTIHVNEH